MLQARITPTVKKLDLNSCQAKLTNLYGSWLDTIPQHLCSYISIEDSLCMITFCSGWSAWVRASALCVVQRFEVRFFFGLVARSRIQTSKSCDSNPKPNFRSLEIRK